MHDGGPVITSKYMWMAIIRAIFHTMMSLGWAYLLYLNTVTYNDPQLIRSIYGAICGFFVGWNIYETIKDWKNFAKERKNYKALIDANSDFV